MRLDASLSTKASLPASRALSPAKANWRIAARISLPSPWPPLPGASHEKLDTVPNRVKFVAMRHADRFAVDEHGEVQPPRVRAHACAGGPDGAQPLPFAFRVVGVERARVVERPRLGVGDPGPHERHETFQQFVGCADQLQLGRS